MEDTDLSYSLGFLSIKKFGDNTDPNSPDNQVIGTNPLGELTSQVADLGTNGISG